MWVKQAGVGDQKGRDTGKLGTIVVWAAEMNLGHAVTLEGRGERRRRDGRRGKENLAEKEL